MNNAVEKNVAGMQRVQIVTIGKGLVRTDGSISHHDMFDYKNLTNTGARKVFEPVHDLLSQILNENNSQGSHEADIEKDDCTEE